MDDDDPMDCIPFFGGINEPKPGEHDLGQLVLEVVGRLPEDVRDWLLIETRHFFVAGSGELGALHNAYVHPGHAGPDGMIHLRIIFLSENVAKEPREEALFTIAHEIAHSRLNHLPGAIAPVKSRDREAAADALAAEWGFPPSADRREFLAGKYYRD